MPQCFISVKAHLFSSIYCWASTHGRKCGPTQLTRPDRGKKGWKLNWEQTTPFSWAKDFTQTIRKVSVFMGFSAIVKDSKHSQICDMKGGLGFWDPWLELPCHPLWKDWPHLCLMKLLWGFSASSSLTILFALCVHKSEFLTNPQHVKASLMMLY